MWSGWPYSPSGPKVSTTWGRKRRISSTRRSTTSVSAGVDEGPGVLVCLPALHSRIAVAPDVVAAQRRARTAQESSTLRISPSVSLVADPSCRISPSSPSVVVSSRTSTPRRVWAASAPPTGNASSSGWAKQASNRCSGISTFRHYFNLNAEIILSIRIFRVENAGEGKPGVSDGDGNGHTQSAPAGVGLLDWLARQMAERLPAGRVLPFGWRSRKRTGGATAARSPCWRMPPPRQSPATASREAA